MYRIIRALLFLFPAETAHHLGLFVLEVLGRFQGLCTWIRRRAVPPGVDLSTQVAGITWPTPIGLAAGLDKDAKAVSGLFALGFGAVEVGTLTPRPQPGNPKPRMFRIPEKRALINRLGFNNQGAPAAAERLARRTWKPAPLGVNVGKNKDTPLDRAVDDYLAAVDALAIHGDYVVVNASSPNTPGLRSLQEPEALRTLLTAVRTRVRALEPAAPLFLKIAPDLEPEAVDEIVDVARECGCDGLIATNTTIARPFEHPIAKETGGLSGAPLTARSTEVIRRIYARAQGKLPIIGVGGVFTGEDAYQKLKAGASAVQIYTGFIYGGPGAVKRILRELAALMLRDGYSCVEDLVGADHRAPKPQPV